jgi:hypothetical protein
VGGLCYLQIGGLRSDPATTGGMTDSRDNGKPAVASTSKDSAIELLLGLLGEGEPLPAHLIAQEAAAREISPRTLARAKATLGVQSRKVGAEWVWILPRKTAAKDTTMENSVIAITDASTHASTIPPVSGDPEITFEGKTPEHLRSKRGAGTGTVEALAVIEPKADVDAITPVDNVCGGLEPGVTSNPPTDVEQALFRHLDPNHPPAYFTGQDWRRLVADAHRARDGGWLRRAVEAGWRLEDLFDPRNGGGVLLELSGGTIVRVDSGSATVRTATGGQWVYRRAGRAAALRSR